MKAYEALEVENRNLRIVLAAVLMASGGSVEVDEVCLLEADPEKVGHYPLAEKMSTV